MRARFAPAAMNTRRILRTNDLIKEEVAQLLAREMKDPRLTALVSVTSAEASADLRFCKIFVSVLQDSEAVDTLKLLNGAAGYFRRELAQRLNLRRTPKLEFVLDSSIARGERVIQLLREIGRTGEFSSESQSVVHP